ncbi:MAG: hypothetical protein ABFS16_00440 [Bacteroidota bacterium]
MGFKQKYALHKFRKLAAKQTRKPVVPSLDSAKLIGVIWHPMQKEAYQYLKVYFNKEKVIFRGYCVFDGEINPPADSNTLTGADLTWLGFPKPEKIENFTNINFDILISLTLNQNLVLDTITMLSKAKFKVGWSPNERNFFDLNIKIGENQDALYLAKQQIFYLSQLNQKNI